MQEIPLDESVLVVLLVAIRVGAALRLSPFFGGKPLPLIPWIAVSVVIAFALAPLTGGILPVETTGAELFVLAAKELFIGVSLGTFVYVAFSVLESVGNLTSISAMSMQDIQAEEGSPLGRFYTLLGVAVFLTIGGHHSLITAFSLSMRCFPPTVMPEIGALAGSGASGLIKLFSATMAGSVMIAAPVFVAGLLAELIAGLSDRLMPGIAHGIGVQTVRVLLVQIAVIAALGATLSVSIDLVGQTVTELSVCAGAPH